MIHQKNITQRLEDIRVQAASLDEQVRDLTDGADPMRLSDTLKKLGDAVSAAQSRITTRPNETFSRAEKVAADAKTIADLERLWSRPSAPVPALLEVEEERLIERAASAGPFHPLDRESIGALCALNGLPVTLVWDPVLGTGRIDATDAAATAFLKS